MLNNSVAKQEYRKRPYTDFIAPVLMSLSFPENENVRKTISEIESDACEILDISYDERRSYYNAMYNIRIVRSKLEYALRTMREEKLIEAVGLSEYRITEKGQQELFS